VTSCPKEKGPLICGPVVELPGIEPVSGRWSLSRSGTELRMTSFVIQQN
jgi:hypothetical protein